MEKIKSKTFRYPKSLPAIFLMVLILGTGCQKNIAQQQQAAVGLSSQSKKPIKQKRNFVQTNLVANNTEYAGARVDPVLLNAWGLAWSTTGVAWISA